MKQKLFDDSLEEIELLDRLLLAIVKYRAAADGRRDGVFMSECGIKVGQRRGTFFYVAQKAIETREAVQLFGVPDFGGVKRAAQHGQ